MLRQRIITAVIIIPSILLGVSLVNTSWFALILGVIVCLGAWEWTKFSALYKTVYGVLYVILIFFLLWICFLLQNTAWSLLVIYIGFFWWLIASGLIITIQIKKISITEFSLAKSPKIKLLIGTVVLIPAWLSLVTIHGQIDTKGIQDLIFLFLLVWTADISAYFSGKKWGKKYLASHISKGKTWEGVYGAIVMGSLLAYLYAIRIQLQPHDIIIFLVLSILTVLISIIGDLSESFMKRSVDIKDSGNILPGHGGILDRIDSLTAAAPFYLVVTSLMGIRI